jgi:hypothetical protein
VCEEIKNKNEKRIAVREGHTPLTEAMTLEEFLVFHTKNDFFI